MYKDGGWKRGAREKQRTEAEKGRERWEQKRWGKRGVKGRGCMREGGKAERE